MNTQLELEEPPSTASALTKEYNKNTARTSP